MMMKTQRKEPPQQDFPPGEYFISSFYKTADRGTLIHGKNQRSTNNLSQNLCRA